MKAQLCPKCNGQGIVNKPPWIAGAVTQWTSSATSYPCDVCHGAKIIYVPDDVPAELVKETGIMTPGGSEFINAPERVAEYVNTER